MGRQETEQQQQLSDHTSSGNDEVREQPITTDSNTSSNDEHDSPPSTSDENHKDLIDDTAIRRIEMKLKEIEELEQMNGYDLTSKRLLKINRKQSLLQKMHHLKGGEDNFVLNEWGKV